MLVKKPKTERKYEFNVNIRYIRGIEEQEITVDRYAVVKERGINITDYYNYFAGDLEELLQTIHNESYKHGKVHPIAVIHQLNRIKKSGIKTDWEHSGYYQIIANQSDLMKFLNATYDDVINACTNAELASTPKAVMPSITFIGHSDHTPNRKEVERAIKRMITPSELSPSILPALEVAFRGTRLALLLDYYLKDATFQELTALFRNMFLNTNQLSIYYDRNQYVLTNFDEAGMLFMLMFPSMVYIPSFDGNGQAKCHFREMEAFEEVDLSKGIAEYSNLNYRQIVIYDKPIPIDNSSKFVPCIEFLESVLLGEHAKLRIYPYDIWTGDDRKHMLFNGVPTITLIEQIVRFIKGIPINKG